MAKRMIDCSFIKSDAFSTLNNKCQLLYLKMLVSGDSYGFVDTTQDIIDRLTYNDDISGNVALGLLRDDYISALIILVNKGYLYEFRDKYGNSVYLIRHWFIHNVFQKGLYTKYHKYLRMCTLNKLVYELQEERTKEEKLINNGIANKINKSKLNKSKDKNKFLLSKVNINNNNINNLNNNITELENEDEWNKLMEEVKENEENE